MTDFNQVMAVTLDKPQYPTLALAMKSGANMGVFGGADPATYEAQFKEWRLMGDCLEFRDFGSDDRWAIMGNVQEIIDHKFSGGVWGFNRKFANWH